MMTLMTLSKEARLDNMHLALRLMMAELGEQAIDKGLFDPTQPPFDQVYPTTWQELNDRGLIETHHFIGAVNYELTGEGWLQGLISTRRVQDPTFVRRLEQLSAAMKAQVKGRHYDAFVYIDSLAAAAGLSVDFVFNAVESHLLRRHFRRKDAGWEYAGRLIRIPLDFGMEPL
jgi:hypothetical protein